MKKLDISKKIIGVLGRPSVDDENDKLVAIYDDVRTSIIKKDCIPFMFVPLSTVDYISTKTSDMPKLTDNEKEVLRNMVDICDGIIIPGGYKWFEYDEYVVKYAIEKDIPVLGICMGMQLLSSIDNGGLSLELNETKINHRQRKEKYVHSISIIDNTLLYNIINNNKINVNSNHRYHAVKVNNFVVSAYSEDGLIEAIELQNKKFVLGVQWHPEKMLDYDEYANKLYDCFIGKC
ncbi:MAG: gamma-glutamyl-gamma-aminobutyrate hydrolase family protein [Bacilli bacterium]